MMKRNKRTKIYIGKPMKGIARLNKLDSLQKRIIVRLKRMLEKIESNHKTIGFLCTIHDRAFRLGQIRSLKEAIELVKNGSITEQKPKKIYRKR